MVSEDFYIEKYIADADDASACLRILQDNFNLFKILQKHLLLNQVDEEDSDYDEYDATAINSAKYPYIDWEQIWQYFGDMNDIVKAESHKLKEDTVQDHYLCAMRNDE